MSKEHSDLLDLKNLGAASVNILHARRDQQPCRIKNCGAG